MLRSFIHKWFRNRKKYGQEIAPEDIFLDSSNLPEFNRSQMEGRIEKAISQKHIIVLGVFFALIGLFLFSRAYALQIKNGEMYAKRSENNSLRNDVMFADRGLITDRNGSLLAWNTPQTDDFSRREYVPDGGFGNILGFVKYPAKDKSGFYYKTDISGEDGVESFFDYLQAIASRKKIIKE